MLRVMQEYLNPVEIKYNKAKTKHKRLCDVWTNSTICDIEESLGKLREENDTSESLGGSAFDLLVKEELLEFLQSVEQGDYKNARKELVDIIVLCFRALSKLKS